MATAAALGLVPAQWSSSHPASAAAARRFVPPSTEFVISRSIFRLLSDGKQIIVKRSYRVQFVPDGEGFRLDGVLIAVDVDVPPVLAKLAEVERKRLDNGLFPILLGGDGVIHDQTARAIDRDARQDVVSLGGDLLRNREADSQRRDEGTTLIGRLATSTPGSPWPADLFFAQPGERRLSRQVTLADGSEGSVEVVMRVSALLPCGLPQSVERIVTTHLAGTSRTSREVFTITFPGP
ncbi:MAG: hypothetical protein ABL914_03275 [Novosphingobium sp.]|uniref:hypothetical protein n=1 Tax=Novosphingobium sp. TaxID=1874826 RepID=UPI0032BCC749